MLTTVLAAGALFPAAGPVPNACAASGPHAVLVIDRGSGGGALRPFCVSLDEEIVSGRDFIELAAAQHEEVNQISFGHNGGAVCMLADVGTTESTCLDAGEPHWGYWRSEGNGWRSSPIGFTSTRVEDGDIEGWSWADGPEAPPHPSFESVCGYRASDDSDPPETNPDGGDGDGGPVDGDPGTDASDPDGDAGAGRGEGSGGPSGPSNGAPQRSPNDSPSAEPEPDERLLDTAPDISELGDTPTLTVDSNELPPSATTAVNKETGFPLAGALALIATIGMAGVAVLLVRKRTPAKPED